MKAKEVRRIDVEKGDRTQFLVRLRWHLNTIEKNISNDRDAASEAGDSGPYAVFDHVRTLPTFSEGSISTTQDW